MEEQWRDVENFHGFYQISNTGKLKSVGRIVYYERHGITYSLSVKEKICKTFINKYGYEHTCLHINGKSINVYIARLVAMAFVKNTRSNPAINHKDGNKLNNNAENLEFVTNYENTQHAIKNGLMPQQKKGKESHNWGKSRSKESRIKQSLKMKGIKKSPEHRAKIGLANTGKHRSEETRRKISETKKGTHATIETKANMSAAQRGKVLSEEHKIKIGLGNKGKIISQETRDKMKLSAQKRRERERELKLAQIENDNKT
jgi:hypothetical protein